MLFLRFRNAAKFSQSQYLGQIRSKMASKTLKECFIKPLTDRHPPIRIDTERKFIGRSPETQIQDPCCSRQQVCLKANLPGGFVLVKSLGSNPSVLNGKQLEKDLGYEAYDGDILELLPGNHQYTFEFKFEEKKVKPTKERKDSKKEERVKKDSKKEEKRESHKRSLSKDEKRDEGESGEKKSKKRREERTGSSSSSASVEKVSNGGSSKKTLVPTKECKWEDLDGKQLYIYTSKDLVASEKVASYDMDGTLIKTKSGNVFPKTIDDWQIAFPEVPGKLKTLHKNGFKIVIFTNQAGISKGKLKIEEFRTKIEALQAKLNLPMQVFISTGKGKYRKPLTGMWDTLCQLKNDGVKVDKARSFYVGDAAGRPEVKKPVKRKKDHSCADRLMALNVGIPFLTPEAHFQNAKEADWVKPEFDPRVALEKRQQLDPPGSKLTSSQQEVIVMVGFPGSGKSHFARAQLESKGYVHINRDALGSWQKCVSLLDSTLKSGKRAVVDNTNPDVDSRKRFVELAKKRNVPCRCFVMGATYKQSRHNNVFRELTDRSHSSINDMVFNMYKSKYQEPALSEGFDEIVKVNFVPKFESEADEKLYKLYLLES
uniref:Bifunctional polynucleotide phosphatase/kinase n=1 Tax=Culex pipiens TaxID=7175 RepID=A0A8D8HAT3_CULPI